LLHDLPLYKDSLLKDKCLPTKKQLPLH